MARTKTTSRKKAPAFGRARPPGETLVGPDYDATYDSYNKDVLGDDDSDSDGDYDFKGKGKRRDEEEDQEQQETPFMLFDFRRGVDHFPENVQIVDSKKAEELLEKATAAAEEAAKLKKSDKDDEDDVGKDKKADASYSGTGTGTGTTTHTSWGESKGGDDADSKDDNGISDAVFETLKDGSTALVIKPGYRLKLDLSSLLEGGDAKKEERAKAAEKERKRKEKRGASKYSGMTVWGGGGGGGDWGDDKGWGSSSKWFKEYINAYTITMDIKLLEEPPREGISLFQTGLIHSEENKRSGKTTLSRSDGECVVNQAGGVGMFGTYGDTTKAKLTVGSWKRVVVTVKCAASGEKGEMRTWVGIEAGVVLKEESIVANERFALDPDGLYLFSSASGAMMPGNIAIRAVRVEAEFSTDQEVTANRARDKLLSLFEEERIAEVQEQRKGLSLATLFPKPRPMWVTPSLVAVFGDAFIEKTTLEGSSNLAWSYTVLNFALQRMGNQKLLTGDGSGLNHEARVSLADTLHVMQQSALVFKHMLRMLKTPSESQLLSFLRKLKKILQALNQGESLLLPLLIERRELLLLLERTTERVFKVVVIQTDPYHGLKNHSVSAASSAPDIKYRTCLVLNNITKKNALDDVFWVAVYNLAIHTHQGDTDKFYDVLLPFLTGKPLEECLVESETAALESEQATIAPGSLDKFGEWRSPQRSQTAYVRCVLEAMHYMLRRRGVTDLQADLIHLGLCYEMVSMVKNDLVYILPDENGQRVCALAVRELSHFAVQLVDKAEANPPQDESMKVDTGFIIGEIHQLTEDVSASLSFCKDDSVAAPPELDLSEPETKDPSDPALTQFRNMLAWDIPNADPDPGQAVSLRKYIPVDLLQIPQKASTRTQAITAIRMCDRICTLLENQSHCIKNDKFIIAAAIEHLFTQVLPIPKPRAVEMTESEIHIAERSVRRTEKKEAEAALKAAEKAKRQEEKRQREGADAKGSSKSRNKKDAKDADEKEVKEIKIQCFGEEILPDFAAGKSAEKAVTELDCIWDAPITYELQVELLITLQRLAEHFSAAAMSIQQSRPFDGVCIVVPGCICAIADALMRRIATDEPSEICSHLMGRTVSGRQLGHSGFGISVGSFATQSETIEIHYPELSVARTAVLDYFQSPAQRRLLKVFSWEENYFLHPGKNLIKFIRMVSREIGLPVGRPQNQLCDSRPTSSHLMKNYPELQCYRDVAFWWKFFLNTDRKVFQNYSDPENPRDIPRQDRMAAQLNFTWDEANGAYEVVAMGVSLKCRPDPRQTNPLTGKIIEPEHLPTHRFPSTATPSFYVPLPPIKTEDDVIYRPNLPSFEDKFGQILNQRDSELLISYLTVPYMRLPLLITFFSSEDRIHKLQCAELRQILDSVMFEPGKYLAVDMGGVEPMMVPTRHPELLATPYGLLMNELYRSPDTIIRSILTLLRGALAVDTGSVVDEGAKEFNTSTMIILYITRLAARVDNYFTFLIDWTKKQHDCVDAPLREVEVYDDTLQKLVQGQASLRSLLHVQFENLFEDYLRRLDVQTSSDPNNESLIDRNSRLACDLHSHKLLLYRNFHDHELTPAAVKTLVGSFVYLTTRHTWNKATTENARLQFPETELYELLQVQRRRLVKWASSCKQGVLDEVMQTALQISSSLTGSMKTSASVLDNQNRWSRIQGSRSCGRWAVGSTRTVGTKDSSDFPDDDDELPAPPKLMAQTSYNHEVGEVADTGMLGVEIDVQLGQMTLRSKHLAALPSDIANHPDVKMVFGDSTIQASLVERAENRQCYRLVGLNHELQYWSSPHTVCPALGDEWEREYDPAELFESEKWIVNLFEPVRKAFFDGPQPPPMQFMMPERALPEDAEVAVLMGLHQSIGGPWKLVYLFRRLRCIHVYECISQGREWFFSLHMTTDTRYTLRELQPSMRDRQHQYPDWWIRGSGNPYPVGMNDYLVNELEGNSSNPASSVLVVRDQQHIKNLSGGKEVLVPSRLLYGLIPDALLDAYTFWQDESIVPQGTTIDDFAMASRGYKRLRGYPKEEDGEFMIFVETSCIGSFDENISPTNSFNNGNVIQCTGLPGRTVSVIRRPKKLVEAEFRFRQQISSLCESLHLLVPPSSKKKESDDTEAVDEEMVFKVDSLVECDYEGKGEFWPCVVRRVNDNSTYDLEYVNDYKWVGIQRGVDPEVVQKRGENEKKARGEGIWHWDGMSDSEDEDFREDSDDEDEEGKGEKKNKERINFYQFDELGRVIAAAKGNEDACLDALNRIGCVPGAMPFTDVSKLAAAVEREMSRGFAVHGKSMTPVDSEDYVLLNLLYAPRRSRLHSLMKTLARIENASNICAWTKASNPEVSTPCYGLKFGCPPIDLVELPRLKLAFTARPDHEGVLRLYSVDHVDIFITNERNSLTAKMLAGIPHSLLLSNVRGETQVLVPVIPPHRPFIQTEPFTTFIVLDRKNIPLSERFFLYPVHVSLSFLLTKGLNSAIYLMLLRFLHRDYADVFRLADSIATDTNFNAEGSQIFSRFAGTCNDWHPDAHACRLKISLVTIDSGATSPWDLTIECARHAVKLDSVTSSCRLAPEEELQILESDAVVTSSDDKNYDEKIHDDYSMAICFNRKHQLRAQMEMRKPGMVCADGMKVECRVPPRKLLTNWPYYQDNTVFGENYAQMVDITSADEGENSWAVQKCGGDDIDSPPKGWLVVACFHTLWSAGCIKVMPSVTELVPLYQDMATFLTVRADCHGMAPISKSLNITTFPTFVFFRGGKEVERIVGHDRVVEKLVRSLASHLDDADKVCHAKRRHRIRLEKALELGLDAPPEEEPDEQGELEWTWDPESAGECMRIENEGMLAIMRDDEDDADPIQWEWSRNNRSDWKEFSAATSRELEKAYKKGKIYSGYATTKELSIWPSDIVISTYEVTGFYASWNDGTTSAYVRRRGDRLSVPNEENYLTKEQKERDERSQQWRDRYEAYKKKIREEKYGNDIEAIKGTIGMLPNTGVHKWTLKWNHEPARKGVSDGIGLCSDAFESFGPVRGPCLGGSGDTGTSLALYSNGMMYHNGNLINEVTGSRNIEPPKVDESVAVEDEGEESGDEEEQKAKRRAKKKAERKKKKEEAAIAAKKALREVKLEDRAPLFGLDSLVTCEFDSGLNGGTLRFFIDKQLVENILVENVYGLLGASEVFPCLCVCPFDRIDEDVKAAAVAAAAAAAAPVAKAAVAEDSEDSEDDAEEEGDEEEGGEEGEGDEEHAVEEEEDDDDNYPSVTLLPPGWEEEEARRKEAELVAAEAAIVAAAEAEAAALVAQQEALAAAELAAAQPAVDPIAVDAEGGIEVVNSDANAEREINGSAAIESADPAVVDGEAPPEGEDVAAATAKEVDIPMERIRWMWESDSGWQVYSVENSVELEEAQREGMTNYTLTIGTGTHKCNLEGKVITDDTDGSARRLRRHVIGEGMAGMWELLTMRYDKPMGLSGQGFLKTLEKVWGSAESMDGKQTGLGFLFLYSLLSGESRSKVISAGYGGSSYNVGGNYMSYGGKSGYSAYAKKGGSSSSDSHRFALLLSQLLVDRHTKSLPASVVNVLGRNRQVSLRMPRFKDCRKATGTPYFNGWIDETEPRSPIAELFQKLVPLMKSMKRKAAFHFPPPPPHVELAAPKTEYVLPSPEEAVGTKYVEWERPELSDYGCERRSLTAVPVAAVASLASSVHYRLGKDTLRPNPPRSVADSNDFRKVIELNPDRLYVVDFYATWCGPCKALAPVFRQLALRTPTVVFLKVDVDECDKLAAEFQIDSFPTVKFLRGGCKPSNVVAEIKGGGPQFLTEFAKVLQAASTAAEGTLLRRFLMNSPGENVDVVLRNMATNDTEMKVLAFHPLKSVCDVVTSRRRIELGMDEVDPKLAFDVSAHEASKTAVAESVLVRIKEDVAAYADAANLSPIPKIAKLSDTDVKSFFNGDDGAEEIIRDAHQSVQRLLQNLYQLRNTDAQMVEDTIPLLEKASNWVDVDDEVDDKVRDSKTRFLLNRRAGQNSEVWIEFLFGVLISSKGAEDLLRLNPYLTKETVDVMFNLVTMSMLRANRLGHTNRCIGITIGLDSLLRKILRIPKDERKAQGPTLLPKLIQVGEELSKNITMARHYIAPSSAGTLDFDPRYLVFEFVWNIQLRQKQVEIVDNFRENLNNGVSKVKQMIMGAGKTSVVAPLLALILADGKSLVLSVVPKALVEMSRTRMRETFAAIMVKRIYTLDFDRSTTVRPAMRRSLENAARNRGVVVATPTTVKSIALSYIEVLQQLKEAYSLGVRSKLDELKVQADELSKILKLFKDGVMLLDEVDLILHPLKSELNFPIGDKFDLDGSEEGERWNLPIHLLDAVFFTQTGKVSTFEQRGVASDILKRFTSVIQAGVAGRHLQRLPHITLLNNDFYHEQMKPVMAEWAYLWLQKQHLHGIDRGEAVRYMLEGAAARSDNTTKINLIELGLTKALVDMGDLPPMPVPTLGYQKSMTDGERLRTNSEMQRMQEEAAANFHSNQELEVLIPAQIRHLQQAKAIAEDHAKMVNDVYDIDEQIEDHMSGGGRKLGELQSEIFALHKKIAELECPRDDSLDNSIIVWLSQAFASLNTGAGAGAATSATPSESSVPALCNVLEDLGFTVRRCSEVEEAIARARDLQSEGQLRCVIVGGDEHGAGCGSNCVKSHSTKCLRCSGSFLNHFGHNCPSGGRGSFLLEGNDSGVEKVGMLKLMQTLTDEESPHARLHGALPASRTAVYSAHTTVKEDDRLSFWKLGTTVTDESKHLVTWVSSLKGWGEEDLEENKEGEDDAEDAGADDQDLPSAPSLTRQSSSMNDKIMLQKLRAQLEDLESRKAALTEDDDTVRKNMVARVTEKNKCLEDSVSARVEELTSSSSVFDELVGLTGGNSDIDELRRLFIGPHSGRDCALALAWLEVNEAKVRAAGSALDYAGRAILNKHAMNVKNELAFLKQMSLAAKVIAHVSSPMHKKLLNLCHNWLSTFMPHCLAKVNRVSFGLLSAKDCKAALEADPHVPRSRLKLAVPFVGKDVPSRSSEFAHPDVIIGLTIMAYRYSGLRRDDYVDVVDGLTSQFSHEIGPARDRESSQRHERWVHAAGGAIRGLKGTRDGRLWTAVEGDTDKEVVQLKFLQKSNEEQMDKLYNLIAYEPLVIHHYLQKTIFPLHMRSQRMKISASGQCVGGDMLVGKRVGFSGTPSDLLPQELGRCDYETGDDGMMLTTVLDRNVTSYEFMEDKWDVEQLLQRIATAENPRYNALIDTGALITGYSNNEVAEKLLELGLAWCDGVVFLDDDDKQQVLVRATGRVVSADQCGVPLERRFAFYDQIHTTGMDIKHVVNATAVITLGKDMVFRDYVQGAYRMRGIGAGQKIHVFIIPEVAELMNRELRDCVITTPASAKDHVLEDIVAWLVINSLRSEQVQWTMLCLQNIGNLYRKNAFDCLHKGTKYFMDGLNATAAIEDSKEGTEGADESKVDPFTSALDKDASLKVFDESIDFSLEAGVPDPVPFEEKLRSMLDAHEVFLKPEQHAIGHRIMVVVGQFAMLEGSANRLDTEQEREQEQEQEKEVEARRDQQIEVEKFVDREYSRQEEVQRPWPFSMLARPISTTEEHPFYSLSDFKLRHQEPLEFSDGLYVSTNYFNPKWTGLRRVKNVIMVMEYAPSTDPADLCLKTVDEVRVELSEEQERALAKAHTLLGFEGMAVGKPHHLTRRDLANAITAAIDQTPTEEMLDSIMATFSADKEFLTFNEFRNLMTSGTLYPEHKGRNWVALSLAEAETIRRILHNRQRRVNGQQQPVIDNATTEVALRYSLMNGPNSSLAGDGGVVLDASRNWLDQGSAATAYEAAKAHNSFRFFDCDMHFAPSALNVLIKVIHGSIYDRERFFHATVGCRRRMERKWQETPLARVFTVPHQWLALKQAAQAIFFREALKAKNLTLWEAFTAFDYDNTGMLSPSEFYGALVWLGVPDLTAEDVADFIEAADKNRDGIVDYKEYMDIFSDPSDHHNDQDDGQEEDKEDNVDRVPIAKVEPYGAEELREVMIGRKQAEIARQKEERLRRQAYKDALDVKVFEEELEASKLRKGGANPLVYTVDDLTCDGQVATLTVTDFKFSSNEFPLRLAPTGKCSFVPIFLGTCAYPPIRPLTCPKKHPLGACYYSWMNCDICRKRKTHYYCQRYCGYYLCSSCYESDRRVQELERRDPAKNPTFLRCSNSCSFTLQVPTAGGTSGSDNGCFTISLELRFDKLPPKGHLQSLLRFSLPDLAQARRLHRTSVYLNGDGVVVSKALASGGKAGDDARVMRTGVWHTVTVAVKPEEGEVSAYVNGHLCHMATGLDPTDLRLHHKLVVLGGGRQAHSRGGDIRRVVIHSGAIDSVSARSLFFRLANENPAMGGRAIKIQAAYRGFHTRKVLTAEGVAVKMNRTVAEFVAAPITYSNY